MRKAFAEAAFALAQRDPLVHLITNDVEHEVDAFKEAYPDRYHNLGLCEQTIISFAAGLAGEGLRPLVYSITPFILERPFEQVKIGIDEQNLPVILIGYSDYPTPGPTHRPLHPERLVTVFRNIQSFFPQSAAAARKALDDAYAMRTPSIIFLQKDA